MPWLARSSQILKPMRTKNKYNHLTCTHEARKWLNVLHCGIFKWNRKQNPKELAASTMTLVQLLLVLW